MTSVDLVFFEPHETVVLAKPAGGKGQVLSAAGLNELPDLLRQCGTRVAVILPTKLQNGTSGLSACLEIRSSPATEVIPIVVVIHSPDKAVIRSLYEVGADIVVSDLTNLDDILWQLSALYQRREAFLKKERPAGDNAELVSFLSTFCETCGLATLAFDGAKELLFANNLVHHLLLTESITGLDLKPLWREPPNSKQLPSSSPYLVGTVYPVTLMRPSGLALQCVARRVQILNKQKRPLFTVFSLLDQGPEQYLSGVQDELERARIAILSLAADLVPRYTPGAFTELLHNASSSTARVSAVLTFILELLDKVLPEQSEIRVEARSDGEVSVGQQKLAKLLGLLILHAADYAGLQGEVSVATDINAERTQLVLVVTASSNFVPATVPGDLRLDALTPLTAEEGSKLPYILECARELASASGVALEYREPKEGTLKLRIRLPLLK